MPHTKFILATNNSNRNLYKISSKEEILQSSTQIKLTSKDSNDLDKHPQKVLSTHKETVESIKLKPFIEDKKIDSDQLRLKRIRNLNPGKYSLMTPQLPKATMDTGMKDEGEKQNDCESVQIALQEKLKARAASKNKERMMKLSKEKSSAAEKKRIWKGENGIFNKNRLEDWYKHMNQS